MRKYLTLRLSVQLNVDLGRCIQGIALVCVLS
jgi:hypothetical protein